MSLLEARDIQKRYKDRRVLNGASLSVEPGELVSIVGASGSGKSTLARILCGTVRPDGGEALFDGEPLLPNGRFQPALRRFVQLIPQQQRDLQIQLIFCLATEAALRPGRRFCFHLRRARPIWFLFAHINPIPLMSRIDRNDQLLRFWFRL